MHFVVIANPDSWHFLDLERAVKDLGHTVESIQFEEITGFVGDVAQPESALQRADVIIMRTMPPGSLQQIVFRMDALGRLASRGKLILNKPKTIETAIDKYLTSSLLEQAGLNVPRTFVSQNVDMAMSHFEMLGCDVVVKPIFGSMGRGIRRFRESDLARQQFAELVQNNDVIYQQEFIDHQFDIRVLVVGDRTFAMKRSNPDSWITNISQGGVGEVHEIQAKERDLAVRSAKAVNATFAGVDLLYHRDDGQPYVLEVNGVPGWKATCRVLNIDIAKEMVDVAANLATSRVA